MKKWFIIAVLFPVLSLAQGKEKGEILIISSVGLLTGESTAKPFYQLTGGIEFGRWFAGAGAGYDQYKFNSFPVFTDFRMSFGRQRLGFLYSNFGYNFPASGLKGRDENSPFVSSNKFVGGFYMDAGIGYKIRLGGIHRLLVSGGFSYKQLENKLVLTWWTEPCTSGGCHPEIFRYKYELGRITARISWALGRYSRQH